MIIIYLSTRVTENVSHLHDCPLMLSWVFWLLHLWVIILVSQMPRYAGTGRHCSELMNNVTRDEVDIIISQADGGVFHTISSQLVKFGIINPANTLNKRNGILMNQRGHAPHNPRTGQQTINYVDFACE